MRAEVRIGADEWRAADLLAVDRRVHAAEDAGPFVLVPDAAVADEVWLRYRRVAPVTNEASASQSFAHLLARHRALHDTRKPLVRADLDHAHDTWQWVLRLAPDAGLEVQLAALLHDIERLESEADVRVEQHAPDYSAFKAAHARRGAVIARSLLEPHWCETVVARVEALIATHERPDDDPDRILVNDADALSFFALNCAGYLAYYGPEQTRLKVDYTLARLSAASRPWLARIRLPYGVA